MVHPCSQFRRFDGQGPTQRANWHKVTLEQKELYRQRLDVCLAELSCSLSDVVDCCEPGCTMHCELLDQIGIELTDCLLSCAAGVIPLSGGRVSGKKLAYWHDSAGPARQRSKFWYNVWREAGYPSSGVLFQLKRNAKKRYKYEVRRLQRRQDYLRHKRMMAEALLRNPCRDFWSEVPKSCGKKSTASAPVIDGSGGDIDIANLWRTKFQQLLNTSDSQHADVLLDELDHLTTLGGVHEVMISAEAVCESVQKLKRGKSDGGSLLSDHVIEAPVSLHLFLANFFTALLRHGHVPSSFRDAILLPIPKGLKDPSDSSNYRGIALASCVSKVLEWSTNLVAIFCNK